MQRWGTSPRAALWLAGDKPPRYYVVAGGTLARDEDTGGIATIHLVAQALRQAQDTFATCCPVAQVCNLCHVAVLSEYRASPITLQVKAVEPLDRYCIPHCSAFIAKPLAP